MRLRTVRLHRDLAAFVLDQMNANPEADKHAKGIVKTAVERVTHLAELASDLRARLGEGYTDSPDWHAAMQDFRSAFTAAHLPVGGPQQIKDAARVLAHNLHIEVPAFAQDPQPRSKPVKPAASTPAPTSTPAPVAAAKVKQTAKVKQADKPSKASAPQRVKTSASSDQQATDKQASEPTPATSAA